LAGFEVTLYGRFWVTPEGRTNSRKEYYRSVVLALLIRIVAGGKECPHGNSIPPVVPEVGIFWFIQEPGEVPKFIGSGVAVGDGEPYGNTSTIPANTHASGSR